MYIQVYTVHCTWLYLGTALNIKHEQFYDSFFLTNLAVAHKKLAGTYKMYLSVQIEHVMHTVSFISK